MTEDRARADVTRASRRHAGPITGAHSRSHGHRRDGGREEEVAVLHWLRHRLALFTYSWRALGLVPMVRGARAWLAESAARASGSAVDDVYGTDTGGRLAPGEVDIPAARRATATMYLPTNDHDLAAMLAALPWPAARRRRATFVDLGSGKGRVVLLAALGHFREVVGVELSPVLHATAVRNLARMRAAGAALSPVRLVHDDAVGFEPPAGPLIVFLYHPFRAPIAAQVMARLRASLEAAPRPVAILYGHPSVQPPFADAIFDHERMFARVAQDAPRPGHPRPGWSVWSNRAWLERRVAPASALAAGEY